MNKKIFVFLILLLVVSFSTESFASLTFTSNAITGTTASSIDLGAGNTLSLNTTNNAPITTGTGLVTLGGSLKVTSLTAGRIPFASTGGLLVDDSNFTYDNSIGSLRSNFLNLSGTVNSSGSLYPLSIETGFPVHNQFVYAATIQATSSEDDTSAKSLLKLMGNYGGNSTGSTAPSYGLYSSIYGDSKTPMSSFSSLFLPSVGIYSEVLDGGYGGDTIGAYSYSVNETNRSIGTLSQGRWGVLSIGGVFYARSGTNNIGLIGTLNSAIPTATSAAILADNGAIAAPIFLGRDNGGTVFTIADGGAVTSTSSVTSTQYKLSALNTAPSSATDTGTAGEVRFTTTGIYICVATNSWIKAAAAAW